MWISDCMLLSIDSAARVCQSSSFGVHLLAFGIRIIDSFGYRQSKNWMQFNWPPTGVPVGVLAHMRTFIINFTRLPFCILPDIVLRRIFGRLRIHVNNEWCMRDRLSGRSGRLYVYFLIHHRSLSEASHDDYCCPHLLILQCISSVTSTSTCAGHFACARTDYIARSKRH